MINSLYSANFAAMGEQTGNFGGQIQGLVESKKLTLMLKRQCWPNQINLDTVQICNDFAPGKSVAVETRIDDAQPVAGQGSVQ